MRGRVAISVCAWVIAIQSHAQTLGPTLSNGVITYVAESGQRKEIRVGKECSDLWISPDESLIAFVVIQKGRRPKASFEHDDPFIEESSIYLARRSDHYNPVRLDLKPILIDGRQWKVVRQPSVSPDLDTVYFSVPYTMTTWKLMSASIRTGKVSTICDADDYCVVWGGEHSGELLMRARREEEEGAIYPFILRNRSGVLVRFENEHGWFGEFAARWSRDHGGTCRVGDTGINRVSPMRK